MKFLYKKIGELKNHEKTKNWLKERKVGKYIIKIEKYILKREKYYKNKF